MSRNSKYSARIDSGLVEIKSKFDAEFRRFSMPRQGTTFEDFYKRIEDIHGLQKVPFLITYTDPEGDLLPINNDDNYNKALTTARPVIRLCIQRKGTEGESMLELNGFGTAQRKKNPIISRLINSEPAVTKRSVQIGIPEDFRRVSAIIDVDIIPETHRRVKLIKRGTDKPLGFYIRDGTSLKVTPHGLEKAPGVYISRLIPGGLAEMTGLLAVNDEVLEVNGIEVSGKTLDQVTDMMVANSANLIITVKPVNQRNNISPRRGGSGRLSQKSTGSYASAQSQQSQPSMYDSDEVPDENDEVKDYSAPEEASGASGTSGASTSASSPTVLASAASTTKQAQSTTTPTKKDSSQRSSRSSSKEGSMPKESIQKSKSKSPSPSVTGEGKENADKNSNNQVSAVSAVSAAPTTPMLSL